MEQEKFRQAKSLSCEISNTEKEINKLKEAMSFISQHNYYTVKLIVMGDHTEKELKLGDEILEKIKNVVLNGKELLENKKKDLEEQFKNL